MIFLSFVYILIYISVVKFLKIPFKKNIHFLYTLLAISVFSLYKNIPELNNFGDFEYPLLLTSFGIFAYSIKRSNYVFYISATFLILDIFALLFYQDVLNIVTGVLIFLYLFLNLRDTLWVMTFTLNSIVTIYRVEYAEVSFLVAFIYILKKLSEFVKENLEKEKRYYRTQLSQQVDKEINQKLSELNEEIGIVNKKVKSLFELSNYTISTSSIEDLAERVVKGLKNLGYTGALFFLEKNEQLFKEGFFPNLIVLLRQIRNSLQQTKVLENMYVFIPIFTGRERIGFIGTYKKSGIREDEVEYLSIYANTISIFLEKVYYSKEITKLRELTYRILEAIDIGIAVVDKNFNILFKNKAFERDFSQEPSDSLFNSIPRLKIVENELKKVVEYKSRFETVLSSVKQGEYIYQIKAFPTSLYDNADIDSFILLIEDVTEREELEAHVIQTEKLAVLGKLVAGLSHDIRNPLAAIAQAAFRIKKLSIKKEDQKLEELARVIEKNVERTSDIMERLLNFSKPAHQKAEIINIEDLIDESLELSLVRRHQVSIDKYIEKDIYIYGDKNALIHAFVNIIINALEAMDYRGNLNISVTERDGKVTVKISDSGKGIPEHVKDRIFEPFFTTKDEGTGLGLFITYKVIKEHGGDISLKTEPKKGTTFIIELPAVEEQ